MALSSAAKRKEVKKSSYYVWFLGAKESRGLRGEEYIRPVVSYLTEREAEVEPLKVTLQVSGKGMKIIQNSKPCSKGRPEVTKHFIPDHSITCVVQDAPPNDDVVACILLIYNPVSKCPVHVHAYRCDSVETAAILRQHLRALVERPDNQRKFGELERRLVAKGLLPSPKRPSSEGRSIRTESDSSGGGSGSDRDVYALDERMSNLYDSLAAELREKLNNKRNHGPMLLPPRDYDTVNRARSNGTTVTNKKVSKNGRDVAAEPDSSGKSSGIGSDEAPSSPTHERGVAPPPKKPLHDENSSDEEWERHRDPQAKTESDMILVQSPPSPRRRRLRRSPSPPPPATMHPPSPKLPPYRERYYEGERQPEDGERHLPLAAPRQAATMDDEREHHRFQAVATRQSAMTTDDERERHRFQAAHREDTRYVAAAPRPRQFDPHSDERQQLRRSKSRDEKEPVGSPERLIRRSKSRDEKDYVRDKDPYSTHAPSQHVGYLSHSRSFDKLEDPKRGGQGPYRPRDGWASDVSPPPPLVSAPSDYGAPYREGYVPPLPRIRRLDSGQSSMPSSGHHSGGPRYQEIPDEKRYPGLDRETARVQHHYTGAPTPKARSNYGREPQWEPRERERYEYSQAPAGGVHRPVFPYAKTSPERSVGDKGLQKRPQAEPTHEDKRFYRYSSSDQDYRPSGHRMSAAAGYHY